MRRAIRSSPLGSNGEFAEDRGTCDPGHLHRAHGNWLIAFLRRRFGPDEAEDLAQEAYVRLVGKDVQIRNPQAFLARVALNAARDQARRRAARPTLISEDAVPLPASTADQDQALLLKQVVLSLPPRLRETFVLSRFAGLSYEEIAARLGISVKTVEKRITQALALCGKALRD